MNTRSLELLIVKFSTLLLFFMLLFALLWRQDRISAVYNDSRKLLYARGIVVFGIDVVQFNVHRHARIGMIVRSVTVGVDTILRRISAPHIIALSFYAVINPIIRQIEPPFQQRSIDYRERSSEEDFEMCRNNRRLHSVFGVVKWVGSSRKDNPRRM